MSQSKRVDRIESSKEPKPVPSSSDVSEITACPPSPIADDTSVLPFPTSSPSSSQSVTLLACSLNASPCMPAVVLYCKIKNVFFNFCVFKIYYLCKNFNNLLQHSTIEPIV